MKIKEVLKIKKAIFDLSDSIGVDPLQLSKSIILLHPEAKDTLIGASIVWNEYDNLTYQERVEILYKEMKE